MKKVIILSGPTASGKTSGAITLAQKLQGEVVNFDSLLFYKELNIGTAKPTVEERKDIPHHLIDIKSISNPINAADFSALAKPVINEIHSRNKIPILTGGSGFYLQALVEGMWNSPTTPQEITERSDSLYSSEGIAPFIKVLSKEDRESFLRLHENDHYRIRRAVEHFWTHGTPFSIAKMAFTPIPPPEWALLHLYLDIPKEDHHKIIIQRTEEMIQRGLIDEVKHLLDLGFSGTEKPLQAIGYKETLDFIQGLYGDKINDYKERIIINTRQLAKAQRTWFKKKEKFQFDPRHEGESLMAKAKEFISQE
ncbi:MAG: tRNA (adenosine(37)-N6)-dimethylallyltransferase MiaA [Bacteriovoracaceae bacterium]|nr:tRNA (adenosine(37)-N6)-dimethylallyltransferase MiaA [Bacteriovoracaceae bacterium]